MNVILRLFAAKSSLKQVSVLQWNFGKNELLNTLLCFVLLTADVSAKTHELSSKHADLCLVRGFASVAHCSFCAPLLGFDCGFLNQSLECVKHKAFKQCFYRVDKTRYLPSKNEEIACDVCENLKQTECYFTEISMSYCVLGHC